MRQKKEITDLLNNPNAPPPILKQVDVITQKEKVNDELKKNEIKFEFKPSKDMVDSKQRGYIKYYF